MSKHAPLSADEFKSFVSCEKTFARLEEFVRSRGVKPNQVRVLDWGCGRGRAVLWLRERGYHAYGVDIDPTLFEGSRALFEEKQQDISCLKPLALDNRTEFENQSFDFIFSNQVFEHVEDISAAAIEIRRLLKVDGISFHSFPACWRPVECHLFMPLVHWFPKNKLRLWAIRACVALGIEPHWEVVAELSGVERAERYFRYSVEKTFYRRPSQLERLFSQAGFDTTFISAETALARSKLPSVLGDTWLPVRNLLNFLLARFRTVDLVLRPARSERQLT